MTNTTNELKTTMKQMARLTTFEVRQVANGARVTGDERMAAAAVAELRRRGR